MHCSNCLRTVCRSPLREIAFQGFIKGNFAWISSKLLIALVSMRKGLVGELVYITVSLVLV
jgi:hypothetical protein